MRYPKPKSLTTGESDSLRVRKTGQRGSSASAEPEPGRSSRPGVLADHRPAQRGDPLPDLELGERPSRSAPSLTKAGPERLPLSRRWTRKFALPRRPPGMASKGTNRDCETGMGMTLWASIPPRGQEHSLFRPPASGQTRNGVLSRNRSPLKRRSPEIIERVAYFPAWQFQTCMLVQMLHLMEHSVTQVVQIKVDERVRRDYA